MKYPLWWLRADKYEIKTFKMWKILSRAFHSSELTNGIRVASINTPAEFDAAGLVIKYSGLSSKLQKCALAFDKALFKGNKMLPEEELLTRLDAIVGSSHQKVGREHMIVGGAVSPSCLGDLVALLRDLVRCPPGKISSKELRQAVEYDLLEMRTKHMDKLLPELAIAAGYPGLGTSAVDFMLSEGQEECDLEEFWKAAAVPSNLALIGLSGNIDHCRFVELANRLFIDWPVSCTGDVPNNGHSNVKFVPTTGEIKTLEDPEMPLTHIVIAYPGLPLPNQNSVALRVLERLLGGGGSFSAGGPGKGMYARLYTSVLNRHYWMESAKCFSRAFSNHGIFGIHGSAPPAYSRDLAKVLINALHDTATRSVSFEELARAKAQLKSSALMDAESRTGQLDDAADQLTSVGDYSMPADFANAVEAVTGEQLQALARSLVAGRPVMAAFGTIDRLPSIESMLI
jgi:processing peptidase subunit alpha